MPEIIAGGSGPPREQLSVGDGTMADPEKGSEMHLLQRSLQHGFEDSRSLDTRVLQDNYQDYYDTIRFAAEVAKSQFGLDFGGIVADSDNEFVMDHPHSGYFGYNDWSNLADVSADSTFTWIDEDAVDNLSGSAGEPVTIGEPVVHLIFGVGSYDTSPKTTRMQMEINDKPKTSISTGHFFQSTDIAVKWLDSPILIRKDDEFLVDAYSGEAGTESLFFEGVTFVKNRQARNLDPAQLANDGSTDNEYPVSL